MAMTTPLRAHVKNGRLILDEPTDLPDGTVIELLPIEDDLEEEDRVRLHAAIRRGIQETRAGESVPAEEFLRELRSRDTRVVVDQSTQRADVVR